MSDVYFSSIGQQSYRNDLRMRVDTSNLGQSSYWVPRAPTRWTEYLQMELLTFFESVDYPFRHILEIPFEDPLRSEIRRFFISLDAYIESPNPVIPYRDILYGATYENYSETLKRIKRKAFETSWYAEHFSFPEWWEKIPTYRIKDIGDIFNYSYLIFWEEDTDDYLWGFEPILGKNTRITHFKECLKDLLPDRNSFDKINDIEVLSTIASSMAYDQKHEKHAPHYMIKQNYLKFSKTRGISERSRIRVSPNNCRDSVLNNPSDLNTISLIDQQLMEVLRAMPGHIHIRNKEEVSRRYKSLHRKYSYFLHRDMKKEGITKPRVLLKVMLEVLSEEYPDIPIFGYTSFYENFTLRVDGELKYPIRGHGLGMANTLTTLMQLVIHTMIVDELQDDIPFLDSKALALNDDFVAGFNMLEHLEAYWDKEDEVMSDLSLIREPNKSFYTYGQFVLAERYFGRLGEHEKISYQLRELLLPLACVNVTHAKEYFSSVQTYVNSKLIPTYMDEIQSYWGYEFFPDEFRYPTKVGGWVNEKVNSVDMTLVMLDQLDYNSFVNRGFNAHITKIHKRMTGDLFDPPIMRLMGYPNVPKEHFESLNILPESALHDKFGKILSKSPQQFLKYWGNLKKARLKAFNRPFDVTYEDLIRRIVSSYETTQFYPSEIMIKKFHPCNIYSGNVSDPYIDLNPIMAMISKYNETSYPFKEDFSISFSDNDNSTKKVSSLFSKEIQRTLKSEAISVMFTGRFHEIYYPSDDYLPEEQYLNPIKIGEITSMINWGKGYPELLPEFISPIIEKKRSVFNRLFTLNELFLITRSGISRKVLKMITNYLDNNPQESFISVVDYLVNQVKDYKHKLHLEKFENIEYEPEPEEVGDIPESPDYTTIKLSDLISDGQYLFYSWRHDEKSFRPKNSRVSYILGRLDMLLIDATFPMLRKPEERIVIRDNILSGEDKVLSFIAQRLGILKMLGGESMMDDLDDQDGFQDLFGSD